MQKRIGDMVTLSEAFNLGLKLETPGDERCRWCERKLEPIGIIRDNKTILWISHKACECDGAKAERAKIAEEEARAEAIKLERAFITCGVKRRFLDAEITRPAIAKYLNSFSEEPGIGLFITGSSRAGKTYAASAIAKAFVAAGYSTRLTTSLEMLDSIKSSYEEKGIDGCARYAGCDVLIIDDLGKENANSWVMTTLFQVINARYESLRPTIVTSQYEPAELCKRMSRQGERESAVAITERLKETCWLVRVSRRNNEDLVKGELRDA